MTFLPFLFPPFSPPPPSSKKKKKKKLFLKIKFRECEAFRMQLSCPSGCVVPILQIEKSCSVFQMSASQPPLSYSRIKTISGIRLEIELLGVLDTAKFPAKSSTIIQPTRLSSPVSPLQYIPICYKKQVYFYFRFYHLVISEIEHLFRHVFLFFQESF